MRLLTPLLLIAALLFAADPADAGVQPPPLAYQGASATVKAGVVGKAATVMCPKGTRVTGGGAQVQDSSYDVTLIGSHPFDGRDRDRKPDDGWRAVASNLTGEPKALNVWVVCSEGTFRYVTQSADIPANSEVEVLARCPLDTSIAGGGALVDKHEKLRLEASVPNPESADEEEPHDDRWFARGVNGSSKVQSVRSYAICDVAGTYSYEMAGTSLSTGETDTLSVDCVGLSRVTGGGVALVNDAVAAVGASRPHTRDPDGIVDDGWTAVATNTGPSDPMVVVGICLEP